MLVLELDTECGTEVMLMRCPENMRSARGELLVMSVVRFSLQEWHDPSVHREDNDAEGEQVRHYGLVSHIELDLRR